MSNHPPFGQFNIREAGLLLIMGLDTFLDMGRTATNALGNSVAAAVGTKWEGQLGVVMSDGEYTALVGEREPAGDKGNTSGERALA